MTNGAAGKPTIIAGKCKDYVASTLSQDDKGDKEDYDKVIIEPLVYSEECGYVVSGIIDFMKDGQWVARFDYGGGTCDDLITKYTKDNSAGYIFSMNDYPEFNK